VLVDGSNFTLCEVAFGKVNICNRQHARANAVLISFHASRVQHMQISEYLLIRNCRAVRSLYQFLYYYSKYLNSTKCREISMGPSKCTNQGSSTLFVSNEYLEISLLMFIFESFLT
jgi:hypothetical protein